MEETKVFSPLLVYFGLFPRGIEPSSIHREGDVRLCRDLGGDSLGRDSPTVLGKLKTKVGATLLFAFMREELI